LRKAYYDIRAGIGDYKTPAGYGAFPMDPYSHTPAQGGARQPGLTGQVKEDFLCRFGELGVFVEQGRIQFSPCLLDHDEFLKERTEFDYFDVHGQKRRLRLNAGELAFTYCQVPVIYRHARADSLTLFLADRSKRLEAQLQLDARTSRSILDRTGKIERIEVGLSERQGAPMVRDSLPASRLCIKLK
jgi:hypothetical protein